jgi:hypothetical protein
MIKVPKNIKDNIQNVNVTQNQFWVSSGLSERNKQPYNIQKIIEVINMDEYTIFTNTYLLTKYQRLNLFWNCCLFFK